MSAAKIMIMASESTEDLESLASKVVTLKYLEISIPNQSDAQDELDEIDVNEWFAGSQSEFIRGNTLVKIRVPKKAITG